MEFSSPEAGPTLSRCDALARDRRFESVSSGGHLGAIEQETYQASAGTVAVDEALDQIAHGKGASCANF